MFWTLKRKMLAGSGMSLLLTMLVLYWSLSDISKIGKESYHSLQKEFQSLFLVHMLISDITNQNRLLYRSLAFKEKPPDEFFHRTTHFQSTLSTLRNINISQQFLKQLDQIQNKYSVFLTRMKKSEQSEVSDIQFTLKDIEHLEKDIQAVTMRCLMLQNDIETNIRKSILNANKTSRRAVLSLTILGLVLISLTIGFSLFLSHRFLKPLHRVMTAMKSLGAGNYKIRLDSNCDDEFEKLACEFNAMASMLQSYHELNIEELLREKRKNELMIQNIDDAIIFVDGAFRISDINPAALQVLEETKKSDVVGKELIEVIGNEKLCAYIKKSADQGEPIHLKDGQNILTARYDNNEHRYFQFSVIPVKSDEGDLSGVILLLKDVTGLKELDRLKSEFVMIASHELRTPLTSIGMSIDLLRENTMEKLSDDEKELLLAAHEDIQRLKDLVGDLLDLSKIEAGKIEMEFEPVDIEFLFKKAVSNLKTQADEKSVSLSYTAVDGLGPVRVDADKILWVLNNLISNALRYTKSGGSIKLSANKKDESIQVSVEDDGIGIPEDYKERIFEKFVQIKDGRSTSGSGLGLAICREIIRAHGGKIWVESMEGHGSTFYFTLQRAEPVVEGKDDV